MKAEQKFGLVGRNISYSFSQKYFTEKFKKLFLENHFYEVFDIQNIEEIKNVLGIENLKGFNVTIPYKEQIIPFLDELSEEAKEIGAVNTVLIKDGKTTGYNTDAFGFEKTLLLHKKENQNSAIVLGDGGAAKAVKFILKKHKIPYITVARKSEINFQNLSDDMVQEHKIIIQCTPVGTFPNVEDCLDFPFKSVTSEHLIIDLIYNPEYTEFIKKASLQGAKTANGYYMLEQQAEKAWEIWRY
ncbi:MAG: shikimate dehydrogenase [Cruoricaptor ignavus]|nr:shikimate dehydrogenase [Cruoricaptor ignavus]